MAELVEYALVILASTLVVGFSVANYASYSSSIESSAQRATFSSYVTLALGAVERGESSASLTMENASLSCDSGTLAFSSPTLSGDARLPVECHFGYAGLTGTRRLTFVYSGGVLDLEMK